MAEDSTGEKYLIYQLGTESFATPLIEVREVIEYRPAKTIPHTPTFFKGVINIRGENVGVIDLRDRLDIKSEAPPATQLVFETEAGPLAAVVDFVQSVSVIEEKDIERRATVQSAGSNRAYFLGVGKVNEKLLTLVSLRLILTAEQLTQLPTTTSV